MNPSIQMKAAEMGGSGGGLWQESLEQRRRVRKIGLRIFLATLSSLFFLFIVAYMVRAQYNDWEHLTAPWQPLSDASQLWVSSLLLVFSSAAMQWARLSSRKGDLAGTRAAMLVAGLFAVGFLVGQLWLWRDLMALGYFLSSNPANSFFYVFTGLHGVHLLGGMVAWSFTTGKVWRSDTTDAIKNSVDLCTLYWHFLLFIWLVLFALLSSSPEAFEAFAELCGLR